MKWPAFVICIKYYSRKSPSVLYRVLQWFGFGDVCKCSCLLFILRFLTTPSLRFVMLSYGCEQIFLHLYIVTPIGLRFTSMVCWMQWEYMRTCLQLFIMVTSSFLYVVAIYKKMILSLGIKKKELCFNRNELF